MNSMTSLRIFVTICVIFATMSCTRAGRTVVGGLSDDTKPANNEVRELVNSFKGEIEQETNKKYKTIEPLTYKTQVVAGLNYFIKARAVAEDGAETILHLRIYKHFKDAPRLTAVRTGETLQSPILHFDH